MKIGILGGTFDPVHLGHLRLARVARDQGLLDSVIFVPAFQSPFKQDLSYPPSAADRFAMVQLAIAGESRFEISDCEIQRKGVSYTIDTIAHFESQYPGSKFYLILGKDAFQEIDSWHRVPELKRKVCFLVAKRENENEIQREGACVEWLEMPLCPISASGIREALKSNRNVDDYLNPEVRRYIQTHGLYRKNK